MAILNIKEFVQEAWLVRPVKGEDGVEVSVGDQAVKDSVVAFLAGLRSGSACTKTKGLVAGGGAKPWRQKGTGRARSGSSRPPLWRGGGVTFGPLPRSYAKKVNQKVEQLALRRTFTDRLDAEDVILVDALPDMTVEGAPKTAKFTAFLKEIGAGTHTLVLDGDLEINAECAVRNLPETLLMSAATVNPYLLMYFKKIVITKAGLEVLGARFA